MGSLADKMKASLVAKGMDKAPIPSSAADRPLTLSARMGFTGVNIDPALRILFDQRPGVGNSFDLQRVLALPRRTPVATDDLISDMTNRLRTPHGTMRLRPVQALSLSEIGSQRGLLGMIGVGEGKTLISLLAATVLGFDKAVLLIPPQLREQLTKTDLPHYRKHWRIVDDIHVVPYSMLSNYRHANVLEDIQPPLIVADEAHTFREKNSARTKRFFRYMRGMPETVFVALSGSMTNDSLKDYGPLAELALHDGSPLPHDYENLREWAMALDQTDDPIPIGALDQFCNIGETAREGFQRRLRETPGVIVTGEADFKKPLIIETRPLPVTTAVKSALKKLRDTWCTPGDEELKDSLEFYRAARQLACGFYYRWVWPNGERDEEWLDARATWHREMRNYLHHHSRPGMDSPLLLARAAASGKWASTAWPAWAAVKDHPEPDTEEVWVSDVMINDAVEWGRTHRGLIWYENPPLGMRVAKAGGFVFCGSGVEGSKRLFAEVAAGGPSTVVVSIKAHGTGKNLQPWSDNLVLQPPANGTAWEQMLGRTHRPGQKASEVRYWVYQHTDEMQRALEDSIKDACYIQESTGQRQKLLMAMFRGD